MEINFLTGPVTISEQVKKAFCTAPISHRSSEFLHIFSLLKNDLLSYTNAAHVEVITGSGSLANEVVAQQIKQIHGKGIILNNGEFGKRLTIQANTIGLDFYEYSAEWSKGFDWNEIKNFILEKNNISWLWMVLHETSTGIWNEDKDFFNFCKENNILLHVDAISALGVKKVDLSPFSFCTGVSGKAFAAYPGLCFVFYNQNLKSFPSIPQYLDLHYYQSNHGIPYTINSNLVKALQIAIQECVSYDGEVNYEPFINAAKKFAKKLNATIINTHTAAPNNVTMQLSEGWNSVEIGNALQKMNCHVGYKSGYLVARNWIQFYFTRNNSLIEINAFESILETILSEQLVS